MKQLMDNKTRYTQGEEGQMAVELAIVTPVILLILVIAIDMLVFASECARFDHIAPQCVLASASSPDMDSYGSYVRAEDILESLEEDFATNGSMIEVTWEDAGVPLSSMTVYRCTLHFAPWPFSIAGAPAFLKHEVSIAIDPYTPGELL